MSVSEILTEKGREVFTANFDNKIEEIAKVLAEKKIGAAIILDNKNDVCGIASERDIVREIAKSGSAALSRPVSVCMTQKIISCNETDTLDGLMEKMSQGRFRHLPVIQDGKLSGIISIGDVVKHKIMQAEREAEDMRRYIAG